MSDVPASMPERLGRYELLFPVGTGGMGTVYLARTEVVPGVQRHVAIKLMHEALRADEEVAPQLMREAEIAASIRHPNVVAVHEAGDGPHGVYLVMDCVEGDTLAALIRAARKRDEPMPLRIAAKILRDALTGLHAAHELKGADGQPLELVHRDFSPHNILVGSNGISQLTDFGIAKALSGHAATATGIVKGKVGYMAPEQARGERVDRRTDVWAAGVVAWETFTSHRLFHADNDAATLLMVVSGKRPPLMSHMRRDIPPSLDQAIAGALEAKPGRRLASAQALRSAIEQALPAGIADDEEVAAYLEEMVGDKLADRRARAREVLALRDKIADLSQEPVSDPAVSTLGTPPEARELREVSTRSALSASTSAPRSSNRWIAAGLVVLGGAAAVAVWSQRREPEAPASADTTSVAPSAVEAPKSIHIRADAPIAQLEIDSRTILLPEAAREIEVPWAGEPATRLVALTRDGRKLEVQLAPGQTTVTLAFPAQAAPSASLAASAAIPPRRATVPRVAPPAPATKEPKLADSPYGAR